MTRSVYRKKERQLRTGSFLIVLLLFVGVVVLCLASGHFLAILGSLLLLCGYIYVSRHWMISDNKGIPVLTFHSVSNNKSDVVSEYLTVSLEDFSSMLDLLAKKGYRSVELEDVQAHMEGSRIQKGNVFAITFDDGYLDNWVYAFPVMKTRGFSGTLFVATDFITEGNIIRPQIEYPEWDVQPRKELKADGYLSSAELMAMEESGVFTIESHMVTHTWLYNSDVLVDFVQPNDPKMIWLLWNQEPKEKSQWFEDFETKKQLLLGHPVFDFSRSHVTEKAFYPNKQLVVGTQEFILKAGGVDFFKTPQWRQNLNSAYLKLLSAHPGRWETSCAAEQRIKNEFYESKKILEGLLSKTIRYLCWPGDIHTEALLQKAITTYGYRGTTGGTGRNSIGENPSIISRIFVKYRYVPIHSVNLNTLLFYAELKTFEGNFYYYIVCLFFNQFNKLLKLVHYRELKSKKAL